MRCWAVTLVTLAACGGGPVTLGHSGTTSGDECPGAETYVDGISATTDQSGTTVTIVSASPTPPDVGDDAWVLQLSDDSGPLPGLAPTITPWMPLHGHGLVPPDYAATDQGDGTYPVETFDLIMPGLWEFRVDLTADDPPDEAVFRFCAEG